MSFIESSKHIGMAMFVTSVIGYVWKASPVRKLSCAAVINKKSLSAVMNSPPRAKKVEEIMYYGVNPKNPNEVRGETPMNPPKTKIDYYNWLRDNSRKDEEVLSHIKAENDYCSQQMARLEHLQTELYNDMLSHLKETDSDVPYPHGSYSYYSRTEKGLSYKIHCRKSADSAIEEVVLDENAVASGHEYSVVGTRKPSPDHTLLAYTVDQSGYETYSVRIKNLSTGELLADSVEGCDETVQWGGDQSCCFYLRVDEEHRPYKVHMHVIGTSQEEDICLFEETDNRFWVGLRKSASGRYLIIDSGSKETSEIHVVDLLDIRGGSQHREAATRMKYISRRENGVRYEVEHIPSTVEGQKDVFAIISNINDAKNFKLSTVDVDLIGDSATWIEVKPYNSAIQIQEMQPFRSHLVMYGRQDGKETIWICSVNDLASWHRLPFDEECYSVSFGDNHNFDNANVRLVYSSFLTPKTVFDLHLTSLEKRILKVDEVPGYDPSLYESKRMLVPVRDGTNVPCSLVYRKSSSPFKSTGPKPTLLYGYGSYGYSIDPTFDFKRTTLLDRGVVYAIAHIRGGGEMGRSWYEDEGKYLKKRNTFNDFGDCAAYFSKSGITTPSQLAIVGRSAGGLLMGAVSNNFGNLVKAVVADVPFVDVMNTMSDPTIPLTVTEWLEWGNPNEEKFFSYMNSYSPYDNVESKPYPSMLVTGGLFDPRVPYWEPVKWVAKLRELKTDNNPLLLKVDLSSGHFSASDRYKYIREMAHEYAFILDQIGAV